MASASWVLRDNDYFKALEKWVERKKRNAIIWENFSFPAIYFITEVFILIFIRFLIIKLIPGTSLVAQWLRIRLPMQGHRCEPWSGKIPRATEQLSPRATTTEAHTLPEPVLLNKRSHRNQKPAHRNEE